MLLSVADFGRAKQRCTTGTQWRITRWEHQHMLETAPKRLDQNQQAMRQRRETVEHPFGTLKMRMGATHFLMKRLPKVATEMALPVLAYNLTRVINILGVQPLMAAMRALSHPNKFIHLAAPTKCQRSYQKAFLHGQDPTETCRALVFGTPPIIHRWRARSAAGPFH